MLNAPLLLLFLGCTHPTEPSTSFLEQPFKGAQNPEFVTLTTDNSCDTEVVSLSDLAPFVSKYRGRLSSGDMLLDFNRGPLTTVAACRTTEPRCEQIDCVDFTSCCVLGEFPTR